MAQYELFTNLRLNLFEGGEGGGAGSASATGGSPDGATKTDLSQVAYGKEQVASAPAPEAQEDTEAAFENDIKGKYKEHFDKRVQNIINKRFKETKELEDRVKQAEQLNPVLDVLASKYGVDVHDTEALVKAVQDDDSYYEDEALKRGLTVSQYKQMQQLERENATYRKEREERQKNEEINAIYGRLNQQSEELRATYPSFNLEQELAGEQGKQFRDLLKVGVDVRTAYEVIHKDEIIGGAMQYTAQQVAQKTVNDIRARGNRPQENGNARKGAITIRKSDPSTLTRKDREEISRRVMRGERIVW